MKKLFQHKWTVLALVLVPNLVIAFAMYGAEVPFYTLGSALGAASVVYLLYYASRILLSRTKLRREWIIPLSLVLGYAIYAVCFYLF